MIERVLPDEHQKWDNYRKPVIEVSVMGECGGICRTSPGDKRTEEIIGVAVTINVRGTLRYRTLAQACVL